MIRVALRENPFPSARPSVTTRPQIWYHEAMRIFISFLALHIALSGNLWAATPSANETERPADGNVVTSPFDVEQRIPWTTSRLQIGRASGGEKG